MVRFVWNVVHVVKSSKPMRNDWEVFGLLAAFLRPITTAIDSFEECLVFSHRQYVECWIERNTRARAQHKVSTPRTHG